MTLRDGIFSSILIVLLLLSGCAEVGPNFRQPEATVSSAWLEAGDPRVKTDPAEYKNWWQTFKDPVLDRLMDRAYGENLSSQDRRRAGSGGHGPGWALPSGASILKINRPSVLSSIIGPVTGPPRPLSPAT